MKGIRFKFQSIRPIAEGVKAYDFEIIRRYGIAGEKKVGIATCYNDDGEDSFCFIELYPFTIKELNEIAMIFSNSFERNRFLENKNKVQ